MRKRLLIAAAGALFASALAAQTLTLRDAAAEALNRNPQMAAAASESDAARARLNQARATWLPMVDASANSSRSNNPVFVFASLLEQGRFAPQFFDPNFLNNPPIFRNDRLTLTVKYAFFDQMRRYDMTKQAGYGITRARTAADEARQRLLSDVITRYYGLTVAEQRQAVAAEAVRAAEAAAKATRDKAAQGLVVESDRLGAEVQLAQFRQQEIEAAGDADVARAALAMTLQRPITERIAVDPALPEKTFPQMDLNAATAEAIRNRGEVAVGAGRARRRGAPASHRARLAPPPPRRLRVVGRERLDLQQPQLRSHHGPRGQHRHLRRRQVRAHRGSESGSRGREGHGDDDARQGGDGDRQRLASRQRRAAAARGGPHGRRSGCLRRAHRAGPLRERPDDDHRGAAGPDRSGGGAPGAPRRTTSIHHRLRRTTSIHRRSS